MVQEREIGWLMAHGVRRGERAEDARNGGIAPLKVGIDVRTFTPAAGQGRYLWRLGGWLGARGHDVHVLSVRPQPDDVEADPGVRLHRLHQTSRRDLRRYVARLELDALLVNPERARRYRGIHANVLRPGYGTEQYRQKLASFRTPIGYGSRRILRGMPWVLLEKRWERRFYEDPAPPPEVIANSHYMRAEVLDSYGVPEGHVHVVHNGVDLDAFSTKARERLRPEERAAWGIPPNAVCMLFMGHNFRLKGLWQMLEVTARLRSEPDAPDLRVIVAGSGVGKGQIRKAHARIRSLGLDDVVHLVGPVHPAIRAFAAADMLMHLSWHDSFGFVILEAMASGLPVLTTRYTGAAELLEDGATAVLVDPGDPRDILRGVRSLLDADARRAMGAAAAEVGARHPEEESFRRVLEVMETARRRGAGTVS